MERELQRRRREQGRAGRKFKGRDCCKWMGKIFSGVLVMVILYWFNEAILYASAAESETMPGDKMGVHCQNGTVEDLNSCSSPATIINTGNLYLQYLNHEKNATGSVLSVFQHDMSGVRQMSCGRVFTDVLMEQMIRAVKNSYNENARKIICVGIKECSPRALWKSYNSTATRNCAEDNNQLVSQYNAMLSAGLLELSDQVYHGMAKIMHNPELYGFSIVRDACSGLGQHGGMGECVAENLACRDLSQRFWWDFCSPTLGENSLLTIRSWIGQPRCFAASSTS